MERLPDAVFVTDLKVEEIGVREASRLDIPTIGLVDTNCDPEAVDYVIPGNDDAIRSNDVIIRAIGDAAAEGRPRAGCRQEQARREAEEQARREAEERAQREAEEKARARGRGAGQARGRGAAAAPRHRPRPRRAAAAPAEQRGRRAASRPPSRTAAAEPEGGTAR